MTNSDKLFCAVVFLLSEIEHLITSGVVLVDLSRVKVKGVSSKGTWKPSRNFVRSSKLASISRFFSSNSLHFRPILKGSQFSIEQQSVVLRRPSKSSSTLNFKRNLTIFKINQNTYFSGRQQFMDRVYFQKGVLLLRVEIEDLVKNSRC